MLIHLISSSDEVSRNIPIYFRSARACVQPCFDTDDEHFGFLSSEAVMSLKCMSSSRYLQDLRRHI